MRLIAIAPTQIESLRFIANHNRGLSTYLIKMRGEKVFHHVVRAEALTLLTIHTQ